jgi:hypothetical protein
MKSVVVVLLAVAAAMAGGCRQEVPYEPMKLGSDLASPSTMHR